MLKKAIARSAIAVTLATLFAASPADAKDTEALRVTVTSRYESTSTSLCSIEFSYRQRMVVDGRLTMVPVQSIVPTGHYEALLVDTSCDGYDIYAFGSCACHYVFVARQ